VIHREQSFPAECSGYRLQHWRCGWPTKEYPASSVFGLEAVTRTFRAHT
jgi:hypothetical protein